VSVHEFTFAIELSGPQEANGMLSDLAARVLQQFGCVCDPGIVEGLQKAVALTTAGDTAPCSVRFTAEGGELRIDVASGARSVWRWSRPIP
jgi:hypothetical protein